MKYSSVLNTIILIYNQMKVHILDLEKEQANLQRIDEPNERTKKNDEG